MPLASMLFSSILAKAPKPSLIESIPKKIKAIPTKACPKNLSRLSKKPIKTPTTNIGTAAGLKLTL